MITSHSATEVTVTSNTHGPLRFEVRPIKDKEDVMTYMDYIMNTYWEKVGKNRRSYYEEYE